MTVGAIIQARMSSTRLPGKVLLPILGRPMLRYTLERLTHARKLDRIIVATSEEKSDDPLYDFCTRSGVTCYRGPLHDVAQRFIAVSDTYHLDAFVRICADSPFVDQQIVDHAVTLFRRRQYPMVTNTFPRSFPKGQSVEVLDVAVFRTTYPKMQEPEDREHVTRYFYTHHNQFAMHNFSADCDMSAMQLSVDTADDFHIAEKIMEKMNRPHWEYGWKDIVQILRKVSLASFTLT